MQTSIVDMCVCGLAFRCLTLKWES